jgi:hypothetical protein
VLNAGTQPCFHVGITQKFYKILRPGFPLVPRDSGLVGVGLWHCSFESPQVSVTCSKV